MNECAAVEQPVTTPSTQGCLWCGQLAAIRRPVAQEDIPILVAQFVRELLKAGTTVTEREPASHLSVPALRVPRVPVSAGRRLPPVALDALERDHIVAVLRQLHGNRMAAARILGISRRALSRRLDRYQIVGDVPRFAAGRRV